jgi:hypothetical protein
MTGIETLADLPRNGPLRFIYVSGHFAPRNKYEIIPIPNVGQSIMDLALIRVRTSSYIYLRCIASIDNKLIRPGAT